MATFWSKTMTFPLWMVRTPEMSAKQGGFADAVGPDDAHHLARRNVNRDIVQRDRRAVSVRHSLDPSEDRARSLWQLDLQVFRPGGSPLVRTIPRPRTPVFTRRLYSLRTSASNCSLTRNISFSRSSWVSTVFGVNCASAATKLTEAGTTYCGTASRMMRASLPKLKSAGGRRRQEDRHVNVLQVKDGQDFAAGGDHFAVAGELVLHSSCSW